MLKQLLNVKVSDTTGGDSSHSLVKQISSTVLPVHLLF